jgi:leader peptidase (prepilin peptidase)/N-methyltransferase
MTAVVVGTAGLLGLAIGSFLNVVLHRVPRGESVVHPPSHCPLCGAQIRARHNVPVLGWLVLRGRCHDCRAPIPARYPLVEAATGAVFALTTVLLLGW